MVPPLHGQFPWKVSGPVGKKADGTAPAEDTIWEVYIQLGGDGAGGVRVLDDGGIHVAAPEHSHVVHG